MCRAILVGLVFGLASLPVGGRAADKKTDNGLGFHDLSLKDATAKAKSGKKVVMVEFGKSDCGNCKLFDEKTLPDKDVQQFLKDKTVAIKFLFDKGKISDELANLLPGGTVRTPTFIFVGADGKVLGSIEGYVEPKAFLEKANKFVK